MDQKEVLLEMVEANKAGFDANYELMMSVHKGNRSALEASIKQGPGPSAEGKKAIEDWLNAYQKRCDSLKKMTDAGYEIVKEHIVGKKEQA